ncbi:MAG: ornithine carbamoyltransferase [Acidobacteria bacterium]|nr:MAG: ornithine carbamoyltransferase [Acidobacteriota bacterium]REK08768.1 MAG: ornithine carbamoyltransferase [Acidobacteriota bacterium]
MSSRVGRLKHLIDWKFWPDDEVRLVLGLARKVKRHRWEYQGHMQGNTLVMLFQKTSTRTRVSFEAGMTELGGHAIHLDWNASNFTLSKVGLETRYLSRNASLIMARLRSNDDLREMERHASVPLINGCCNLYHPCQALADMLTIAEDRAARGKAEDASGANAARLVEGARVVFVGAYNNVVNSLVSICAALGVHLTLVCPLRPAESIDEEARQGLAGLGLLVETLDLRTAVQNADYVYTDTWLDMEYFNDPAYEKEKQRRIELMMPYQLNAEVLEGSSARIMHDMPIHPGYEMSEELVDDERSIIFDQAENRLDAQKAVMLHLLHELK